MDEKVHLRDVAGQLGLSVKMLSGALNGNTVRLADAARQRIRSLAEELGYEPNVVARSMRQGVMPLIGLVAEGLITLPFATEIVRSLDNTGRTYGLSVVATKVGASRSAETRRFMPRAIGFSRQRAAPVTPNFLAASCPPISRR